jgi:hypothetical protein
LVLVSLILAACGISIVHFTFCSDRICQ